MEVGALVEVLNSIQEVDRSETYKRWHILHDLRLNPEALRNYPHSLPIKSFEDGSLLLFLAINRE